MKAGKIKRSSVANTIIYIVLTILSVIWILPIIWLLITSFRAEPGAWTPYIFPKEYTFSNYTRLFTQTELFNYPRWFMNTFVVAVFSCIITTILNLMTSYSLSRLRFKARKTLMNIGLILGMFPGFMSMIAIYFLLKAMGLAQSLVSLVLIYSGGAGLSYYIAKGFFDTIPKSLDEAATIDGASQNMVFGRIILHCPGPLSFIPH